MNFNEFVKEIEKDTRIAVVKKNSEKIWCKSNFWGKNIREIPINVTPDLSFLSGIIIGDGHLTKDGRFRITIEMANRGLMKLVMLKFNKTFKLDLKLKKKLDTRENRKIRWKIEFDNKAVWTLFNKIFEIPCGKKSDKVKIPDYIKKNMGCLKFFLSGLFLADGGNKNGRISFTSSSEALSSDIKKALNRFNISPFTSSWKHNVSKKPIFDVIIGKEEDANRFKNTFPFVSLKL